MLTQIAERFVPAGVSLEQVDQLWAALCAENPRFFDGSLLHVLGVSRNGHGGVSIHVQECSYRFYAVQKSGLDCGVRPLGVKGIAVLRDGVGRTRFLMGRRSSSVAFYPQQWEFVPGGGLEPNVPPVVALTRELVEEATLTPRTPPVAIALLYDPFATSWEIVHSFELEQGACAELSWEYDEFVFAQLDELPAPLAPVATQMCSLALRIAGGERSGSR